MGTNMNKMSKVNLIRLKTILEELLPESLQILNVVILTIAEDGIGRDVIVNENFDTDNVAVVVVDHLEDPRLNITMFSSKEGEQDLRSILLKNVDWTLELEFAGLTDSHIDIIKELCDHQSESWIYTTCHVYGIWPDTSLKVGIPSSPALSFKVLNESFAPLLNSHWKFRDSKTEAMIAGLARLGKVFGLFVPSEDMPVAWMLMYSQGSLGMLSTVKRFRKQGFGSFLVQKVLQEAVKEGVVPYVHIEDDNLQSQEFFTKLGFSKMDKAVRINHHPCETIERKLYM